MVLVYGNNAIGELDRLDGRRGSGHMSLGDGQTLPAWVMMLRELLEKARENGDNAVGTKDRRLRLNLDPEPSSSRGKAGYRSAA